MIFTTSEAPLSTDSICKLLALGELEPSACTALAVFLALDHAGIAGQETVGLKGRPVGGIDLGKGPGNTMAAGTSLSMGTATDNVDKHIEFVFAGGNLKRLPDISDKFALLEILIDFLSIYEDLAGTFAEEDTGSGAFAPAGTNSEISDHHFPLTLQFNDRGLLSHMGMVRAGVEFDILVKFAA